MKRRIVFAILWVAFAQSALLHAQTSDDPTNLRRTWVVQVVDRTKDAVVNISAEKMVQRLVSPFGANSPFSEFVRPQTVRANSLGSGFIIHSDGYVVTNNHVIDRASAISVELSDGRKFKADLVSSDPQADIAILRIHDPKPLPVIELGDSSDLMIGEPLIAVGNPFGYSHTVSTGIVSALHRNLEDNDTSGMRDLIQTDAAINPGNSGGPLLNAYGEVIGINSAIRNDAQNIGFAIGVNRLRELIPELMNPSETTKVDVHVRLGERRTLAPPSHVYCHVVVADHPDEVISTINGVAPKNIVDAYAMLLRVREGQKISIAFESGRHEQLAARAVEMPDAVVQAKRRFGILVEPVTSTLAQRDHLASEDGLLVTGVDPDSPGGRAGVSRGDVIVRFGRFPVRTLNDLSALMQKLPDSGRVGILVYRGDQELYGYLDLGTQIN